MNSAIYEGWVRHRRWVDVERTFRYRLFMTYLDLDEIERVFRRQPLASARRAAPIWFRRSDYFGNPEQPLAEAVRDRVASETGLRPTGPVRMLTHLRTLGFVLNPVTFYYCFEADGTTVAAVMAEITNTPWNERRVHVLARTPGETSDTVRRKFRKDFHVSPFLDMDYEYDWSFPTPGRHLVVHMENRRDEALHFDATLVLKRRPLTRRSLTATLVRYPLMTFRVLGAIYLQAFRLWRQRCPFYTHPRELPTAPSSTPPSPFGGLPDASAAPSTRDSRDSNMARSA